MAKRQGGGKPSGASTKRKPPPPSRAAAAEDDDADDHHHADDGNTHAAYDGHQAVDFDDDDDDPGSPGEGDHDHDDDSDPSKKLTGRRKKAQQLAKRRSKPGTFEAMGFDPWLLRAIRRKGYSLPTPIQRKAMPLILQGQDVVGMARTGSGKTAAFVLPMLQRLGKHGGGGAEGGGPSPSSSSSTAARALVLSPTRELALQTHKLVRELTARDSDLRAAALVGGDALEAQFAELAARPDILVATPGRLLHHLEEVRGFSLSNVEYCVFDEADRLFEMGFAEQVREIASKLKEGGGGGGRQTLLFSATMPRSLAEFAGAGLCGAPQLVRLDADARLSPDLALAFFSLRAEDKPAALLWLARDLLAAKGQSTLVFASTRHHVEFLHALLLREGCDAACVFGAMDQAARRIHVARFRARRVPILIVTDVAARGIDIPLIDNVVNYDCPPKPELFVHRAGRAARAGRPGAAYTFVAREELPYLLDLHLFLGRRIEAAPSAAVVAELQEDKEEEEEEGGGAGRRKHQGRVGGGGPSSSSSNVGIGGALGRDGAASVVGSFPAAALDPAADHVRAVVSGAPELSGMASTLANAYALYCRTRPPASAESCRRAKATLPHPLPPHPLLVARLPKVRATADARAEAALADFAGKLRAFRPSATVLEAEIARVRPVVGGTGAAMLTEQEAARVFKSNAVMARKRQHHGSVIARQRERDGDAAMGLVAGGGGGVGGGAGASGVVRALAVPSALDAGEEEEQEEEDDDEEDNDDGGSEDDDDGGAAATKTTKERVSKRRCKASAAAASAALQRGDPSVMATGRYRDSDFYVGHTRAEAGSLNAREAAGAGFVEAAERAQLEAAVLDLGGEDSAAMAAQQRQWRWDAKKRKYVRGGDDGGGNGNGRGKARRLDDGGEGGGGGGGSGGGGIPGGRTGPGGKKKKSAVEVGSTYARWAKANKVGGAASSSASAGDKGAAYHRALGARFDPKNRHRSWREAVGGAAKGSGGGGGGGGRGGGGGYGRGRGGDDGDERGDRGPARRGGELKRPEQIAKERRSKAKLQARMKERQKSNAARAGGGKGKGGGGGRKGRR
jgi:ATP-dependent RNA helicase DDX54/DBP10